MNFLLVLAIFALSFNAFAQNEERCACSKKDEPKIELYLAEQIEQREFIAQCEQNSAFNARKIAGRCEWGGSGCPTSLVKPEFPPIAKRLKIYGEAKVEVILDETGAIIYAKMFEGNQIFRISVERAACKSKFTPFIFCGRVVKYKAVIKYFFIS